MPHFTHQDVTLTYQRLNANPSHPDIQLIFAHGWGQSGSAFIPLAQSFLSRYDCYLIDFPGFGASPKPPDHWGTNDYAHFMRVFIANLPPARKRLWVGHSFGCRVGIQLAAQEKPTIDALMLIAAAGIPRPRTFAEKLKRFVRLIGYKLLRRLLIKKSWQERLRQAFGSADYLNAGVLRHIFLNVIREDLTETAAKVNLPCQLIYGEEDRETPPSMGYRFAELLPQADLRTLPDLNHFTVLTDGRHQVAAQLQTMIDG